MRLFVAVLLSDEARDRLAAVQKVLRSRCEGVRWVKPELLHLTVRFLGDVGDGAVSSAAAAVERGAAEAEPFEMSVAGLGAFPPDGPVRVVWAGASDRSGRMAAMERGVRAALDRAGFPPEARAWSPHITLGRARARGWARASGTGRTDGSIDSGRSIRAAIEDAAITALTQSVEELSLMSSVLGRNGPTYERVASARLGG